MTEVAVGDSSAQSNWTARGVATVRRLAASADVRAVIGIALFFALLAALSWRNWGVPSVDAGHELTVAAAITEGLQPYGDIRYFYGPVGVYSLAGAFALLGSSFTTAFAFGLVQAAAIIVAFYALSRQLLTVVPALIATLIVAAIGFSGTPFNFVLPHTNSATFGLLFLLLTLLCLSRERLVLAGLAAGVVGLTRPELAAVAAIALAAYLVGTWRQHGLRPALLALPRLALPALLVAGAVLGLLASEVGAARLFTENLWPVDFLRIAGFASQEAWAPLDFESLVATIARAGIYCTLLAAVVASAVLVARESRTADRIRALWPLPVAIALLTVGAGLWHLLGIFTPAREAIEEECFHLLIGMTWLPALGFAACALVAVRFVRGRSAPITGSWGFDLALVAVAAGLGSRAYDAFTAESSYAPYYAPPLVLLLAVLHDRLSKRWPQARTALLAALAAVGLGIAVYTEVALNPDDSAVVHTARGTFVTTPDSAPVQQAALDFIGQHAAPGEPVLAVPADAGFNFMSKHPPALYDPMFLPGLLDSHADEVAAIARLEAEGIRYAVVDKRTFVNYGYEHFGTEYNRLLAAWIERNGPPVATFGDGSSPGGTNPGTTYSVYRIGP
jgi:hypothetical protein